MRALKSVLLMAGAAKRAAPDSDDEDAVLIAAMRDANLPKLTSEVGAANHSRGKHWHKRVC
jgi:dynein heavy chain